MCVCANTQCEDSQEELDVCVRGMHGVLLGMNAEPKQILWVKISMATLRLNSTTVHKIRKKNQMTFFSDK